MRNIRDFVSDLGKEINLCLDYFGMVWVLLLGNRVPRKLGLPNACLDFYIWDHVCHYKSGVADCICKTFLGFICWILKTCHFHLKSHHLPIEIDGVLLHHGFMFGHLRVGIWYCAYLSFALGFKCAILLWVLGRTSDCQLGQVMLKRVKLKRLDPCRSIAILIYRIKINSTFSL